jgi:NAD(P)H-nitrite reductase large subunit
MITKGILMNKIHVLILGAGPAGLAAAEAAAAQGAEVTLCGEEHYPPYWRPRLTHALSKPEPVEKLLIKKPDWYAQNGVVLLTDRTAQRIDAGHRKVFWKSGDETPYDALVLAAGASPNIPAVAGVKTAYALRSYDDAVKIRQAALETGKAVIIGGGLLGLETAWELNNAGVKTALIERSPWLMPRQLNREGGQYLQHRLEFTGITLITGIDPSNLQEYYAGACVILCAGVQATLTVLEGSGILANRSVIVDDHMRTNMDGIYACGDIAEYQGRNWGLMSVAQEQGKVAGANAAGGDTTYVETPPSPMLKVGAVSVFSVGDVAVGDGIVELSEEKADGYTCLMLKDNVLMGAVLIGNTAAGMKLKKAVAEHRSFAGINSTTEIIGLL